MSLQNTYTPHFKTFSVLYLFSKLKQITLKAIGEFRTLLEIIRDLGGERAVSENQTPQVSQLTEPCGVYFQIFLEDASCDPGNFS